MQTKTQIARDYLMDVITSSPVGTKLPSERELVTHLGFSRPIIQNAINSLLSTGYIYKVDRQGIFVAQNSRFYSLNRQNTFNEIANDLNTVPVTELIEQDIITAGDLVSKEFNCSPDEKIHYFLRLRKHSEMPVELDFSYFADFAVSNISPRYITSSIHKYVEEVKHLAIASSSSVIDAVFPEPEIAERLKLTPEEPLLQLNTYTRLTDGRIFEHTISYIVSRYYKLSVTSLR